MYVYQYLTYFGEKNGADNNKIECNNIYKNSIKICK